MRADSDEAHAYFLRFQTSRDLVVVPSKGTARETSPLVAIMSTEEGWNVVHPEKYEQRGPLIPRTSQRCGSLFKARSHQTNKSLLDDFPSRHRHGSTYGQSTMRLYLKSRRSGLAGINQKSALHDLRHTMGGTGDLQQQGTLGSSERWMGHSNATYAERS